VVRVTTGWFVMFARGREEASFFPSSSLRFSPFRLFAHCPLLLLCICSLLRLFLFFSIESTFVRGLSYCDHTTNLERARGAVPESRTPRVQKLIILPSDGN